jgi:ribosomal protein L37AE/L43A
MGQVVRLAERQRKRQPRKSLGERLYFCTRCEADSFLLYPSGLVQCAHCGAQMENLAVRETPAAPEG